MAHRRLRASLPPLHDQPLNAPPELMRAAAEKNVPGGLMRDIRAISCLERALTPRAGDCVVATLLAMTRVRHPLAYANLLRAWYDTHTPTSTAAAARSSLRRRA